MRVKVGKFTGTVKYAGPVDGSQGEWYGIEWDDPTRGKHNGNYKGTQYFTTVHPTGGSFVKQKKVETGKSFLQGFRERYNEDKVGDVIELHSRQRIEIEFVGEKDVEDRITQHSELHEADLRSLAINDTVEDTLAEECGSLQTLNLADNLISSWTTIERICSQLPNLKSLNISANVLDFGAADMGTSTFESETITSLNLSNVRTGVTWEQVLQLVRHFPHLNELHICEDSLEHFAISEETAPLFAELKMLNLYGNKLASWPEVMTAQLLPRLENLKLTANLLPDCTNFDALAHVHSIALGKNNISDWKTIEALGHVKGIRMLRLLGNPVGAPYTEAVYRKLCIHRLPTVASLNGSRITPIEREIAQRYFAEKSNPTLPQEDALRASLIELSVRIVSVPVPSNTAGVTQKAESLAPQQQSPTSLVESDAQDEAQPPAASLDRAFTVLVPPRLTIWKLKRLFQSKSMADVPVIQQQLHYMDGVAVVMKRNLSVMGDFFS